MAGAALSQGQVQISWQAQHFRKDGADFVAGAMLSQVGYRFRGRRSTFARSGAEFVAGAVLLQDQVQTSWQAQYFREVRYTFCWRQAQHFRKVRYSFGGRRKVRYTFRGKRRTFARSGTDFAAGAALQGTAQISWQAQHFGKVRCRFRGRRSTFARYGAEFDAGAAFSQAVKTKMQK